MKRFLGVLFLMLLAISCVEEVDSVILEQNQVIETNLTISRTDDFADTKATIKKSWAEGDVIFIFFKGIAAPKYLELKFEDGNWVATGKNTLSSADLKNSKDKKMTAVYLPYGGDAVVSASAGGFTFGELVYDGYFLVDENVQYTYDTYLDGEILLSSPSLKVENDKYVHFDITGHDEAHSYVLIQDNVKPITFGSVSADGTLSYNVGSKGEYISGYVDPVNGIVSFSGVLDEAAVGVESEYQFSIEDLTENVIYSRYVGTKNLKGNKFVGIGDISSSNWVVTSYVDLGLSVKWSTCNLGASEPEDYGDYYAWGETQTYYEAGYAQADSPVWKEGKDGYNDSSYSLYNGSSILKYNNDLTKGFVDNKSILDPEDDAAHIILGGNWRIPTSSEWKELMDESKCSWYWTTRKGVSGYKVVSKVNGYRDNYIFLPASSARFFQNLLDKLNSNGHYLTSTISDYSQNACACVDFDSSTKASGGYSRSMGMTVRPVYGKTHFVSEVVLDKTDITLIVGNFERLCATVYPSNAISQSINWSSDNPQVASVNSEGKVVGISVGSANITATSIDGKKFAVCIVNIVDMPQPTIVDLGLSVNWASFNLGASSREEVGNYYTWGETFPKEDYSASTNRWYIDPWTLSKYNEDESLGVVDNKSVLELEDDAAHFNLGGEWRIPTAAEWAELMDAKNCTWTWRTINGVEGYLIKSKKSGYTYNSIFLPVTNGIKSGYKLIFASYNQYWSSTLASNSKVASAINFNSSQYSHASADRTFGLQVRPVCPSNRKVRVTSLTLNQTSISLPVGFSEKLALFVEPLWATEQTIEWVSSDSSVASVSTDGTVVAKGAGEASITATTTDGSEKKVVCKVCVVDAPLPQYVDLGLGVKWGTCNLGTSTPDGVGNLYAWGETMIKDNYTWETYSYGSSSNGPFTKYVTSSSYGVIDGKKVLDLEDDAAYVALGENWRMPTTAEVRELMTNSNCMCVSTLLNHIKGIKVVSKKAGYTGNWIFLSSGSYWTSSLYSSDYMGSMFDTSGDDYISNVWSYRYNGYTIRPVYDEDL